MYLIAEISPEEITAGTYGAVVAASIIIITFWSMFCYSRGYNSGKYEMQCDLVKKGTAKWAFDVHGNRGLEIIQKDE